ncbi:unnamed protein product [Camellia sinensis]
MYLFSLCQSNLKMAATITACTPTSSVALVPKSIVAAPSFSVLVKTFFGRAGLMSFISSVPPNQRPSLFQSLLFEACGRTVKPVNGAVGLLWTGNWHLCQAAVQTVLRGGALRSIPEFLGGAVLTPPDLDEASEAEATCSDMFKLSHHQDPNPKYDCLLFDVDDTLYPLKSGLSTECTKNIIEYMINKLGMEDKAPEMWLPAMVKKGRVRCSMEGKPCEKESMSSSSNTSMAASSIAAACAAAMTMSSPAMALVDDRMSTEGTGLPFGLSNNTLGWILLGVFALIWSLYIVYTSSLDEDEESGLSL